MHDVFLVVDMVRVCQTYHFHVRNMCAAAFVGGFWRVLNYLHCEMSLPAELVCSSSLGICVSVIVELHA